MVRPVSAFSPLADRMVAEDRARSRRIEQIRSRQQLKRRLAYAIGPTLLVAMGVTVMAAAQSSSPFANQKKVNAWELPQAGDPLPDTAAQSTSSPSSTPRFQLRNRSLNSDTASTPPPGAQTNKPAPQPSRSVSATRAPAPKTPTVQAPAPAPRVSDVREEPRSLAPSSSATRSVSASPSPYSSPLTAPPLDPSSLRVPTYSTSPAPQQSVPSANYTYQAPPPPSPNNRAAAGLAGSYGAVPRASVNNPPSSVDNATDYTVHQVPPYYAPGQAPRQRQANQWVQSNNPTGLDYGYARPGQTAPQWEQQAQYEGTPSSGPFAKPYPSEAANAGGSYNYQQPGPYAQGPFEQPRPPGFFNRVGFGGLTTLIRGVIRAGVGARENNDTEETFIGDADVELELSSVTLSGVEWGFHGQVRAQYDDGRKGFVRRLPDCPPTLAGCASIVVPGSPTPASIRGHTTQFYTSGPDVADREQFALESAHLFMRTAYGDVTVGRDDGSAFLFSLGAPTLLNVGASNSPVDYTGLDSVKTVNDASGFAEKITYTSPRLLGDQVGIGIQIGASYAPDAKGCGVDYCVDLNDIPNVVAPDIEDIFEAGIALDRTFAPGVSVEATATYATGKEQSGFAGLDDLEAFNAGLEVRMQDFTLGGSWLHSNQGVMNGDYEAYDVGLTWKPSRLGFTLGYGRGEDDLVGLKSDQFAGGVTWDLNEQARVGFGGQFVDRETLRDIGGVAQLDNDKVTALFVEGSFRF